MTAKSTVDKTESKVKRELAIHKRSESVKRAAHELAHLDVGAALHDTKKAIFTTSH